VAATSFYEQIAANQRNSILLAVVVTAVLAALGFSVGYAVSGDPAGGIGATTLAAGAGIVMSLGSYFAGDKLVLGVSGATPVDETTAPQLINVVREMSLAANLPMPRVYVINDTAPNAFATGRDPKHASIAVTTGLLQKLDREELQGVIGHELSHVRNLDIRFTLIVGVLVGAIVLLADFFLRSLWWGVGGRRSSRDRDGGGLQALFLVIAIVLAVLAPIIAKLIQLAVSRQREYLADVSSVEITRNPYGLERALAKIATDQEALEVANRATAHLYFTNPVKPWEERARDFLSTHPPIVDRINRLRQLTGEQPLGSADVAALAGLE
jgi:heat shock protein HtpX